MKTKFNPWPLGIVLVFVIFIGGMATAVTIACTHRDHLVSENYYEQELNFQNRLEAAARAEKTGASVLLDAAAGKVFIRLPVAQLAQNISGTVELYRPSAPGLDRTIILSPQADGTQSLDVSELTAGAWAVRVNWSAGGKNYFLEQKIKV